MDHLIKAGTDHERVLTALGAYRAIFNGDRALLAEYPKIFSSSYIEYGFMGLLAALVSSMDEPEVFLANEQALLEANRCDDVKPAKKILNTLKTIMDGEAYWVTPSANAIAPESFAAYLAIGRRLIEATAREKHGTPEQFLDRFQELVFNAMSGEG